MTTLGHAASLFRQGGDLMDVATDLDLTAARTALIDSVPTLLDSATQRLPSGANEGQASDGSRCRGLAELPSHLGLAEGLAAALALILIMAGCAHNSDDTPRKVPIPDVTNQNQSDAIATLQAAGFTNLRTQQMPSPTTAPDRIIKTIPAPGETAAVATPILVVVSSGPIQR